MMIYIMQAAKSNVALQAKNKTDEQIQELMSQLEAKNKEIEKLESYIKVITEYPIKEEGASEIEKRQLPRREDVPITGNETSDKLTTENVRLKVIQLNNYIIYIF